MKKLIGILATLLPLSTALAEVAPAPAPAEQSSAMGMVVFAVIFVAMCVAFVWLVLRNDKKQTPEEGEK